MTVLHIEIHTYPYIKVSDLLISFLECSPKSVKANNFLNILFITYLVLEIQKIIKRKIHIHIFTYLRFIRRYVFHTRSVLFDGT